MNELPKKSRAILPLLVVGSIGLILMLVAVVGIGVFFWPRDNDQKKVDSEVTQHSASGHGTRKFENDAKEHEPAKNMKRGEHEDAKKKIDVIQPIETLPAEKKRVTRKPNYFIGSFPDKVRLTYLAYSGAEPIVITNGSTNGYKDLLVWNCETGKLLHALKGHSEAIGSVAFSSDGKIMASGANDIHVWDAQKLAILRTIKGDERFTSCMAFSEDGKFILAGSAPAVAVSNEKRVGKKHYAMRLIDVESGNEIYAFEGHKASISSVAFSPSGRYAASGSWDSTVRLWDIQEKKELHRFQHSSMVHTVFFTADGKLVSGSGNMTGGKGNRTFVDCSLRVWDVEKKTELRRFEEVRVPVNSAAISRDGRFVLCGCGWYDEDIPTDCEIFLWDVEKNILLQRYKEIEIVTSIAFSPDDDVFIYSDRISLKQRKFIKK